MISAPPLRWVLLIVFPAVIHQASSVHFSVEAQSPVSGLLGSSVSLHCAVTNNMDVRSLEVRWYHNTTLIFYESKQVQKSPVDAQYQDRVFLLGDLEKGNVSVKLENLTIADSGDYVCHVSSDTWYGEDRVNLSLRGPTPDSSSSHPPHAASTSDPTPTSITSDPSDASTLDHMHPASTLVPTLASITLDPPHASTLDHMHPAYTSVPTPTSITSDPSDASTLDHMHPASTLVPTLTSITSDLPHNASTSDPTPDSSSSDPLV